MDLLTKSPDQLDLRLPRVRTFPTDPLSPWGQIDQVFDEAPVGLAVFDAALRCVRINRELAAMYKREPDQCLGRSIADLLPVKSAAVSRLLRRILKSGKPVSNLRFKVLVSEDRIPRNWRVGLAPLLDRREHNINGVSVVIQDVTEYMRLRRENRTSAQAWQQTFDSIKDQVLVIDPDHQILRANAAAVKVYSLPMGSLRHGFCFAWMHGHSRAQRECLADRVARSGTHEQMEYHDAVTDRWYLESADPVFDDRGVFGGVIKVLKDITDSKHAQIEIQESRLELAHIRRISTIGELAASIAHELNQPLTAIMSNAQAAIRYLNSATPNVEEVREILDDIVADDRRAGEVIRRLRILLRKTALELAPLSLNEVVLSVTKMLQSDVLLRKAAIQLDLELDLPFVLGDDVQLQQVLLNLVLNGLDAMSETPPDQKVLTIRSQREGSDRLLVSVLDRGHGIGKQHLDRIFAPFFTTKKEGMGMGLAVAHSIIEGHKGRLWAENNRDAGAVFHFTLPVYRTPASQEPGA